MTEKQRLQNFWIEADALSGVGYFDVVNAGLEPVKYHYPVASKQQVSAQLNFKVWERSKLCCYFRCLDLGDYFKMNLFFNAKTGGHYASQQGSIDFKSSGLLGECFLLDIVISEKGYPILKSARMLDDQGVL
ncbi:hypothetical protein QE197_24090 (plasmid) [Arsenophonus nasoniae]|uniref:Uncharacterized protein n=1 Tax=Arsenophonus nasoniae TaxID=638 RepID=D2U2V9_9GAMM|nr:hypothetical protein [Arsenophonus nasoniae]QBY46687.1 hypothetical protein ArsFIN_52980 [Arsenophonus nasoniae]QBY46754.1 hypothetical protein ArsFIN_53650 [Arsenophonus nasoniae]WGM08808.1 hypothetical protein QE258_25945 [Arsenophonus nasoniae]WGM13511.1 hypothetical protein QE197_24090 [Arsenophonus nasoniae]WGM18112.1 hypothetical protein QE193_23555 [Arsenophonus nasoniae]